MKVKHIWLSAVPQYSTEHHGSCTNALKVDRSTKAHDLAAPAVQAFVQAQQEMGLEIGSLGCQIQTNM